MPKLRRRTDGRYYLRGAFPPEYRFCTWQLTAEGVRYLADRGIVLDGDRVEVGEFCYLRDRKFLFTGGGGLHGDSGQSRNAEFERLADQLEEWAAGAGDLDALTRILGDTDDDRGRCFSPGFFNWVARLDGIATFEYLRSVSLADFEILAGRSDSPASPSLAWCLWDRDALLPLWRLTRWTAIAHMLTTQLTGYEEWRTHRLMQWLIRHLNREPLRFTRTENRWLRRPPVVVWRVEDQEVVALLPAQRVPAETDYLAWRIGDSPSVPVDLSGSRIEEQASTPLRPQFPISVCVTYHGPSNRNETSSWQFGLNDSSLVLFELDGTLIDPDRAEPLASGEYLALVRGGDPVSGVCLVERIAIGPIGWLGWRAERVAISSGVPGYWVESRKEPVTWSLGGEPDNEVAWLTGLPVFPGEWPEIAVEPPDGFDGQILRVGLPDGSALEQSIRGPIDLGEIVRSEIDGPFRISVLSWGSLAAMAPDLRFLHLPKLSFTDVEDPIFPQRQRAVAIAPSRTDFQAGYRTQLIHHDGSTLARATDAVQSPAISLRFAQDCSVRIRVRVTRGAFLRPEFDGWEPLPLAEVEWESISLNDRFRLEFHEPPDLLQGRLEWRMSNGEKLTTREGKPLDDAIFEIEAHLLRDGFGSSSTGMVQVRGGSGWIDVFRMWSSRAPLDALERQLEAERPTAPRKWDRTKFDAWTELLPPAPSVLRARCWYHYARSAGNSAELWRSCEEESRESLVGLAPPDAYLLWVWSRLIVGQSVPNEVAELPGPDGRWVGAIRLASEYVRTAWPACQQLPLTILPESRCPVLFEEDEWLLRGLVELASGANSDQNFLDRLSGFDDDFYFALSLLRARRAREENRIEVAKQEYAKAWQASLKPGRGKFQAILTQERIL